MRWEITGNDLPKLFISANSFDEAIADARQIYNEGYNTGRVIKEAEPQGTYTDRLRRKYPFRIRRTGEPEYEGVLRGIQILIDDEIPIYRFPGGECIENPFGIGIEIVEW